MRARNRWPERNDQRQWRFAPNRWFVCLKVDRRNLDRQDQPVLDSTMMKSAHAYDTSHSSTRRKTQTSNHVVWPQRGPRDTRDKPVT